MRQLLTWLAVLVMTAMVAAATPANCPAPPPPTQAVATPGSASSYSFTCGGLTFDTFQVVQASGNFGSNTSPMNLVSATLDSGVVYLNFNPNISNSTSDPQDLWFYFAVTGPLSVLDLWVGGDPSSPSHILEKACDKAFDGGRCTGSVLETIEAFSGTTGQLVLSDPIRSQGKVYIFKDIAVPAGHTLTTFQQSFHTTAEIPEPVSMVLMGSGLLGLGFLRRRRRNA